MLPYGQEAQAFVMPPLVVQFRMPPRARDAYIVWNVWPRAHPDQAATVIDHDRLAGPPNGRKFGPARVILRLLTNSAYAASHASFVYQGFEGIATPQQRLLEEHIIRLTNMMK